MSESLDQFKLEVRAWLLDHCPASMRSPIHNDHDICWGGRDFKFQSDDQRQWLSAMSSRGWTAPGWPAQYGGGGLSPDQVKILKRELTAIGARPALESFGISMLGPALLKFGNESQKLSFLPKIVRGEIRWCQGYSEPNAGSDLASLQTRCEDHDDHFLINGQKIWASYADSSDWIFCLVRTSHGVKKQEGISFILFDMNSSGVTTRPIKLISGSSPFCEIFFENVMVPKQNLVGSLNMGWTIAKYLLTHEREMISGFVSAHSSKSLLGTQLADKLGRCNGRLPNPMLRSDIACWDMDAACFGATMERVRDEARAGQSLGAASSMLKYYGTELNKRRMELIMDAGGCEALGWSGDAFDEGAVCREWLRSKGNSIEGGTSEIQLNIISKRILGLP